MGTPERHDRRCRSRRAALARLLLAAGSSATLPIAWAQTGFDIVQLMRALAQVKSGEASFVEKRSVAMLDRTLEYSGRLSFEAPDTFVRETLKPRRERVAVVGNQVTMSIGQRSRTVALDSVPEASVIVEAVRGTLTGNRDAIERHFSATVTGTPARWALELVPREARLREQVISVRVAGQQSSVREVVVALADGDRSVMTIEPDAPKQVPAPGSIPAPTPAAPPSAPTATTTPASAAAPARPLGPARGANPAGAINADG